MWWSLPIILLTGWISFSYSDIEHASALYAVVMPLLLLLSVMALAVWLILFSWRIGDRGGRRGGNRYDVGVSSDLDIDGGGGD